MYAESFVEARSVLTEMALEKLSVLEAEVQVRLQAMSEEQYRYIYHGSLRDTISAALWRTS